ncbi:MAG: transcription termination/antitermination protein NusA [Spirochaetales bacterium]|nr:transcription termination/antitermination protein NusA [Leptospiraceae bacterium]MCP5483329.1 transcription termination/antitermination protein NusA [Spirochaetales bacterium]MCP5484118.1 transcription termination/antitermination protein NusA [Spirochaetales bacterium]
MARSTKQKTKEGPDLRAFFDYIEDISREKGLDHDEVLEVVSSSLLTAYQKKHGLEADLEVHMDQAAPELFVTHRQHVVEEVTNADRELTVEQARKIKADAKVGDVLEERENPFEFSRIGATNVRQILLQRLKELEREIIYNEFKKKEGELINGYFLRWRDRDVIYVDLGRAEGILPRREQIPGERFRTGDRVKAIIKMVELRREKSREPGPFITLSRATPEFVRRLFEMEIPEIYDEVVEIMDIARQPGYRTKILVRSNRSDVDPVGACVGIKGVRIQSIVRELGNERIDIVNFSQEPEELIANALSPARVLEVRAEPNHREALVVVPDETYSLAIGNNGQNVRLASQLTNYRLTVKSQTQFSEDMSSPEARAELEALFNPPAAEELDYTPLSELPGLTGRIVGLLQEAGVESVEDLIEMEAEELEKLPGIGKNTAKQILKILSESVSFEE